MTTTKTVRVQLAADGFPVLEHPQELDNTRELSEWEDFALDEEKTPGTSQAAPRELVADDITVPVQSSIESTLTFEVLRRQSKEADEDEEKKR
jgi:hypothetical protein